MDLAQNRNGAAQKLWPLDRASIWKPLDKEKREIRILLLQPSKEEDDALYADLEIVSLDNEPEYKAISYVWGDASDTTVMFVNGGKAIEITKSLAAALRCFRDSRTFVALWADTVCINQENLQERADQVRIMGKIFAAAVQVNVWLGRLSDRGWYEPFNSYFKATDMPPTEESLQRLEFFFERFFPEVVENLNISTHRFGPPQWSAWLKILSLCPWFSRLWVMQELVLAKSAIFFSGRHSCTRDALRSALDRVATTRHLILSTTLLVCGPVFASVGATKFVNAADCCAIMLNFSHLNCSNDLDRVYGLLGLCTAVSDFPIDYQKKIEEVFADFAVSCIVSQGPMGVFTTSTCSERRSKLPSWVPDWRGDIVQNTAVLIETAVMHAACPAVLQGLTSKPHPKNDRGKLRISALIFDRLDTCAPQCSDIGNPNACRDDKEQNSLLAKTYQKWQKCFGDHQEILLQVVFCEILENSNGRLRGITPALSEKVERFWTTIESDGANEGDILEFDERLLLLSRVVFAQLLLTTKGRLGNAKSGVQAGDLVALFPRCSIPFIIRPTEEMAEQKTFRLISPCYVHGMMDGEALWDAFIAKANPAQSCPQTRRFLSLDLSCLIKTSKTKSSCRS